MSKASRIIKIEQGAVDRAVEHFELYYDSSREKLESQKLVALLGPPQNGIVLLEYLVGDSYPNSIAIRDAVHEQVEYYLISKREAKPWLYAQHHCGTLANVYSDVHWGFIDVPGMHQVDEAKGEDYGGAL